MPDDLNALFDRISELNGTPKTKLIVELLQAYEPVLTEMLDTLEKIHADKENAQKIVKQSFQAWLCLLIRWVIKNGYAIKNSLLRVLIHPKFSFSRILKI